ncbi:MAG: alternative ribosome rescue aminoacyl-tRNA hydrolase ArfB [Actinomycetota bacterium]
MDGIRVSRNVSIPQHELQFKFSRSGGPGGQNVNTRDTKVEVIFDVTTSPSLGPRQRDRALRRLRPRLDSQGRLHIVVSDERTQTRNRELAVERLRSTLTEALAPGPPRRKPTRPSKGANERRIAGKKARGQLKRRRRGSVDE